MFAAVGISSLIVIVNYLCFITSKKESAKAIFTDSLLDVVFPIFSVFSLYGKKIDIMLSLVQTIILFLSAIYLFYSWITSVRSQNREELDKMSLGLMCLSLALTFLCYFFVKGSIEQNPSNMSFKATLLHFKLDPITKLSFIVSNLISKIKNSDPIISFLDDASVLLVVYSTFTSIIPIISDLFVFI